MEKLCAEKYSLRSILEERYFYMLIDTYNVDIDSIKGIRIVDKINDAIIKCNHENKLISPTLETAVEYEKKLIYKMLDPVLGNSKKMLHPKGNKRKFLLNDDNVLFINFLLDSYYDGMVDVKYLMDGHFKSISQEFREILCKGLIELAENEDTFLTTDYIETRMNSIFEFGYEETINKIKDLEGAVHRYSLDNFGYEDSCCVYESVQEIIKILMDCIPYSSESNKNLPEFDFEELEKNMMRVREETIKRSERIKRGWETRRNKQKD